MIKVDVGQRWNRENNDDNIVYWYVRQSDHEIPPRSSENMQNFSTQMNVWLWK